MTTAHDLLAATDLLLLDFDGPVTKLLPPPSNAALTDAVRTMALGLGVHLDADEITTTDHLAIIRAAHRNGMDALIPVEHEATRLEVEAARTSPITPGVSELLERLHHRQTPVVVVTNNSPECVAEFLRHHDLHNLVDSVIGRDPAHIDRMKPSPWMLNAALARHPHSHAAMLGDSASDATAAKAAGIECIGLAKSQTRAQELKAAGAHFQLLSLVPAVAASHPDPNKTVDERASDQDMGA